MTLRESQKHAQAGFGHLTPCATVAHPAPAAVSPAAGIGVPNTRRIKAPPIEARRFFHARVSSGRRTSYLFMVDGARGRKAACPCAGTPTAHRPPPCAWRRSGGFLDTRSPTP